MKYFVFNPSSGHNFTFTLRLLKMILLKMILLKMILLFLSFLVTMVTGLGTLGTLGTSYSSDTSDTSDTWRSSTELVGCYSKNPNSETGNNFKNVHIVTCLDECSNLIGYSSYMVIHYKKGCQCVKEIRNDTDEYRAPCKHGSFKLIEMSMVNVDSRRLAMNPEYDLETFFEGMACFFILIFFIIVVVVIFVEKYHPRYDSVEMDAMV